MTVNVTDDALVAGDLRDVIAGVPTGPAVVNGDTVTFGAPTANSTTTLLSPLTVNQSNLTIQNNGQGKVVVTGSTITLNGPTTFDVTVANDRLQIGSSLAGAGPVTKTGAGNLFLGDFGVPAVNTYNAGYTVTGGRLQGSTGTIKGDVSLAAGTSLDFSQSGVGTYAGNISGAGSLRQFFSVVTLTGVGTYTGGVSINGEGFIGNADNLKGAIDFASVGNVTFKQDSAGTHTGDITQSGGGIGSLTKTGSGNLTLVGNSTYTGGTLVSAGTLTGDTSSLQGTITNNAITAFNIAAGTSTYAGQMTGTGILQKLGAGELVLSNTTSNYSGGTAILAGTLTGDTTTLQGRFDDSGIMKFVQGVNGTFSGQIGGSGSLLKQGAGTLTLTGANLYTGGTTISAGTLQGSSTAIQGNIIDSAALIFNQDLAGVYVGSITGSGTVTKIGTGNLVMTGTNTYTGGTVVTAGTLTGTTASLQGTIANAAAVVFDQALNGTFTGVVTGAGTFSKQGPGTLTVLNDQTYTGLTTVNVGRLAVEGALASDVTVASLGSIGGHGTTKNLVVAGKVAPGDSIGTLNVAGNFTQASGSSYEVEIAPDGTSDKVVVTGTATIQSGTTVNVLNTGGTYSAQQTYTILTAAGGVSGTYTSITDDLPFQDATLIYGLNSVTLKLIRAATNFAGISSTLNQAGVGHTLDLENPQAVGDLAVALDALLPFTTSQARNALEQLDGELHADVPAVVLQDFTQINHTLSRRLRTITPSWVDRGPVAPAARGAGAVAAAAAAGGAVASPYASGLSLGGEHVDEPSSIWVDGYGGRSQADFDGNARDFAFAGEGFLVGFDHALSLQTLGGVFIGHSDYDLRIGGSNDLANVEGLRTGLFMRHDFEDWRVTAIVSYAGNDISSTRRIQFPGIDRAASTRYDNDGWSGYLEASRHYKQRGWDIDPVASLQYARSRSDGFTESGASSIDLVGGEVHGDSVRGSVGVRAVCATETRGGMRLIPELRARYMHEFNDERRVLTSTLEGAPTTPFAVVGGNLDKNFGVVGGGLTMQTGKDSFAYISYDAQLAERSQTHTGEAGFRITF